MKQPPVVSSEYVWVQGLEKEYDRLLSENDELKRRLSRFDASSPYDHTGRSKKGE